MSEHEIYDEMWILFN